MALPIIVSACFLTQTVLYIAEQIIDYLLKCSKYVTLFAQIITTPGINSMFFTKYALKTIKAFYVTFTLNGRVLCET